MLDSTRADFLFLSLVPRDERGREFTGGQGSRRLKRCFVSGSSRWKERASPIFLSFSFSPFLSLPSRSTEERDSQKYRAFFICAFVGKGRELVGE